MASRLDGSRSPYLRAHAGNPVPWHAWGEEAFAEARRRDVPVMVSIGYSTCHWCHVMARESFEDSAIAAMLAGGFVSVKVDREEHPEVDAAYLNAAAAFTPNLGWPLTVFTTPDGRPFYAGTYFPPEPRAGVPGFGQVLAAVAEAWRERRDEVTATGDAVVSALQETLAAASHADAAIPDAEAVVHAARALAAREDPRHGGFGDGGGPKFPVATAVRFLQARLVRERAPDAAAVADRALAVMAASPLRDGVEGGFFRYATRPDWTVPHYERMLTDNAQLLDAALDAGDTATADGIIGFLVDVLQQPAGGFGAAQDSESTIDGARSEGGYYARDAATRAELDPPAVDGKVVTGWNGLAIGALARAAARAGDDRAEQAARRAADAVLETNVDDDGLLVRASLDEIASRATATLADYGQLAGGLLALAVATGEVAYAVAARDLVRACTPDDGPPTVPGGGDPVLREQRIAAVDAASDGDEPSGPSSIADAALTLWELGAGDPFRRTAERALRTYGATAVTQPLAYGALLGVAARAAVPPRQLVVVAPDARHPLAEVARTRAADLVLVVSPAQARAWQDAGFALLEAKDLRGGRAAAYDCRDFVCELPVTDPEDLRD
ncbi:thioredoxin domain-containing protein [Microbacterium awajiense]|uniref:Thioredoxin domain-containing protein n=1 Tax=Microbacterium awajiense TaxID=415214 RepID=A0ABP7AC74_9MICO